MLPLPQPTVRTLLFWVLGALVLLLGIGLGNQDTVWPALFLLALPVVALLALLVLRPRFVLERSVTPPVVGVREPATVQVLATAVRPSPGGNVVAEDDPGSLLGGPHHAHLHADHAGARTETTYSVRPRRRGRHTLDGFRIRFTDILGFWVHTVRVAQPTELVVTPAVVPLPPSRAAAYGVTGETPIPQTAVSGPDDVLVREYQARDDVRRIHWPSTARSGTLMVRREEAAWDPTAWVLLDSRLGVHPASRDERVTFEWLVSAAASIGLRLLSDGYTVTLIDADGSRHEVSSDRVGASAAWLDPLVDATVSHAPDLHEATVWMAQAHSENRIVALLGGLDRGTADLLAATTASRHERVALVMAPDADARPGFEDGRTVLVDHGWEVREVDATSELAHAWAPEGVAQ
ncbi:DUF58 domain-containing protein [Propioniciclava sinopodophylli]|uniref:DUF58 domain-containing protein n=1 Tax=Propioniciclava sinopodophylli TaxID=1837344 RepID=A0A4Q9KFU4_9ACTN|nr:DUF58 domain-containing protein [Propioniciclava sinopodophylli]TBT87289.1 DUF58 domain-containing protein [Propioniciclava sinopodophylli]